MYDDWFSTCYNLVYTALPVLALSLFDQVFKNIHKQKFFSVFSVLISSSSSPSVQDVNGRWSFYYPKLYIPGQQNMYFNKKSFLLCMMQSCYNSLVLFFVPYGALHDTVRQDGRDITDYQTFALLLQTCLIIVVNTQVRHNRST